MRGKTKINKISSLMESVNIGNTDKVNPPLYKAKHGKHTYGIFKEGAKYIIKRADGDGQFGYINGVKNKSKFMHETHKIAITKLNYLLKETKLIIEDEYVMPIDAPVPAAPVADASNDNLSDVDTTDVSDPDTMPTDDEGGFMGKYGEMVADFEQADEDEKKWLLNSIISKLSTEEDAEVIKSAKEKIVNKADGNDMDVDNMGDDTEGTAPDTDDGTENEMGNEMEGEIEEAVVPKKMKRFYVPYTTLGVGEFKNLSDKEYENLVDADGNATNSAFDGGGIDGGGGMGESYTIKESLSKSEFLKKYGGIKPTAPFSENPTDIKDDTKQPIVKPKLGDIQKAKSIFTTYTGKKNISQGPTAFSEKVPVVKEGIDGTIFGASADPNEETGKSGVVTKPYTEKIWGDNVVNGGDKHKASVGIERYGENKPEYKDQTAVDLTDPKKVQSIEKSSTRTFGITYPQSWLVKEEDLNEIDEMLSEISGMGVSTPRQLYNRIWKKFHREPGYFGELTYNGKMDKVFNVDFDNIESTELLKTYLDQNNIEYMTNNINPKKLMVILSNGRNRMDDMIDDVRE